MANLPQNLIDGALDPRTHLAVRHLRSGKAADVQQLQHPVLHPFRQLKHGVAVEFDQRLLRGVDRQPVPGTLRRSRRGRGRCGRRTGSIFGHLQLDPGFSELDHVSGAEPGPGGDGLPVHAGSGAAGEVFDEQRAVCLRADFGVPAGDLPVRENESGVFAAPDRQRQFPFQRDDPGLAARSCKHKSQHESNPTR